VTTDAPAFAWPLPGHTAISGRFSDPRSYGPHNAIDVPAPSGTPYRALAAGRVAFAGRFGSCGLTVQVDHANGWRSHVCHLSAFHVTAGHNVAQGQFIGDVGSTGDSTGPHAHINLFAPTERPGSRYVPWVGKWAVDPLQYIDPSNTPQPTYYTVVPGDTASQIAQRHGLTWLAFARLNPTGPRSGNWNLIHPGEKYRVA